MQPWDIALLQICNSAHFFDKVKDKVQDDVSKSEFLARRPLVRGPVVRGPVVRGPVVRGPVVRGPVVRARRPPHFFSKTYCIESFICYIPRSVSPVRVRTA